MAFWGIELTPGTPFRLRFDDLEASRLHVSQATLGPTPSDERALVKCKVVDGPEIVICSLLPGIMETCALDLFFCDDCDFVVVGGSSSVHLSGYYFTDGESGSSDSESSMEESEDYDEGGYSFSDDEDMHYQVHASSVKIEELNDEEPFEGDHFIFNGEKEKASHNGLPKKIKKKQNLVKVSNDLRMIEKNKLGEKPDNVKINKDSKAVIDNKNWRTVSDKTGKQNIERDEDVHQKKKKRQDGLPKKKKKQQDVEKSSSILKLEEEKLGEKTSVIQETKDSKAAVESQDEKQEESEDDDGFPINLKRKAEKSDDGQPEKFRAVEQFDATEPESSTVPMPIQGKKKKNRNKVKKEDRENKTPNQDEAKGIMKLVEQFPNVSQQTVCEIKASARKGVPSVRKYPNGLEVQEVQMGKPDGKRATPGKKVEMIYTGKLKSSGQIFDSNIGKKPFQFRLGIGEVIKGWDVGVNGMRVGDKRKLTIPPAMGYGPKAVPGIPPNSWLVFDVELVNAK